MKQQGTATKVNRTYPSDDRSWLGAILPVLATAATLAVMTWFGTSMLGVGQTATMAAILTTFVVALLVAGARLMVRTQAGTALQVDPAPGGRSRTEESQGSFDPLAADLLPVHGRRWSLDVFASIDAQRFAAVCETWFSWAGFDTRSESHRTSDGVDIWLHAPRTPGPVAIVRCKHPQDKPIELQDMREFQDVVANCKPAHGTFTTTSTYTPEALQFAREHGIDAVDGKCLLRRILTRTRQSQQALLMVAFNGR